MKRAAIVLVLIAGCGDGRMNGGEDLANPGNDDMAMNGAPDLKSTDLKGADLKMNPDLIGADLSGPDMVPANLVNEVESVSQHINDSFATAQTVAVGDTIDGTIGDLTPGGVEDIDFYKFNATAGDVIKLTIRARGDYQAAALVRNEALTYEKVATALGGPDVTRSLYIPTTGPYFLIMTDDRNANGAGGIGGATNTYRVTIEKIIVAPVPVTLPVVAMAGMLGADNEVRIFTFTGVAGTGYKAETRAGQLAAPSDLDTALYLVDATTTPPTTIKFNDDIDAGGGNYDSKVTGTAINAGSHVVVLDHYGVFGTVKTWELDIATFDPTQEQESNDTEAQANSIPVPTTLTPSVINGAINRGGGTQDGDIDWFTFDSAANTYYEIVVEPGAGSTAIPAVAWEDPAKNITFANPNLPHATNARLEAMAFDAGTYNILVVDARNTGGPTSVGGAGFTYKVTVRPITRTVLPLGPLPVDTGTQGKIDVGGKTVWYTFDVPAGGSRITWTDLDLSNFSGSDGALLNPYLLLYGADGKTPVAGGTVLMIKDLTLPTGSYTFAVTDNDGGFGAAGFGFRPRLVIAGELAPVVDNGTHTTSATALDLSAQPLAEVASNLPVNGDLWYSLGTLQSTSSLLAEVRSPNGDVDIDFDLVRADGVTSADFDLGTTATLNGSTLPATEVYYLHITYFSGTGPITLRVNRTVCPAPDTTYVPKLFVNEIFPQPAGTGVLGDANGDTIASTTDDEFVEIVNSGTAGQDAEVADVMIRDLGGVRYRAACGQTVAAGTALTVFGGCGGAACAAAPKSNATPGSPLGGVSDAQRLSLDDGGDVVMLIGRDGSVIDRISYGAATLNTSFARGAAGTCDVKGTTFVVQTHPMCTAAVGTFSPNTKATGVAFP